ncbi:hypothetical protein SAMN05216570_2584 [Dyella sp. OK004]|uniref:hypothetical protein n=1 Tax=Dyella sp. OK004 TaxID=1855292 RepID=UPI0008EC990B|nr:hypothetical protein [Dyella sp. OK004]SFS11911.1 hypothetical protein SAMN05216570_2584 [Dyella sp. OK004]
MTNRLIKAFGIAIGYMIVSLATASSPAKHPIPPITKPYAMDKADNVATIDFWVEKGEIDTRRRLMVALDFPQTEKGAVEDAIQQQNLPIEVQVFLEEGKRRLPVPTEDNDTILATAYGTAVKADHPIAHMHLYATDGKTSNVLIAGFRATRDGHYVAIVRTTQDQPIFKDIKTMLRVDEFYNTGE